jgi:pseudoazurin
MERTKIAAVGLRRRLCIALVACAALQAAKADEIRIKMLDTAASGPLAFEPGFVKAKVGDTIVFEPMPKGGHSSVSLLVPAGAHAWSGAVDKETRVTLDTEGIYLYACAAHKRMGMVGVIQVGKPVNLEEANSAAAAESAKFVMNKDRFERELAQVK